MIKQRLLLKLPGRKIPPKLEEIEIYHDEIYDNNERPFGHQFLVVPTRSKSIFNEALMYERERHNAKELTINWKKLRKSSKSRNVVARKWLQCLYAATYNKPFRYIKDRKVLRADPLGIKIGSIFVESIKKLSDDFWLHVENDKEKTRRKYETLLRMGIQGVLHYCFNPEYTDYRAVRVKKFYTDGKVFGIVPLNKNRIIKRLERKCRDYIEISSDINIIPVPKSKKKSPEVNFEELTDLILGSTCYLGQGRRQEWREKIVKPLAKMYNKRGRKKGFKNSPHFRTFTIRYCRINKENELRFEDWLIGDYNHFSKLQREFDF